MTLDELGPTLDIGDGRRLEFFTFDNETVIGAFEYHMSLETGEEHAGSIYFDVPECLGNKPKWTVESWKPLTLSPSILCSCGNHGFIRNGVWVPA